MVQKFNMSHFRVCKRYGDIIGENSDVIISKFFGIFYFFYQSSRVAGNSIASLVLSQSASPLKSEDELEYCGANFCPGIAPDGNNTIINPPAMKEIHTMTSIFLVLSVCAAIVIALFVDPLSRFVDENDDRRASSSKSGLQLFIASFNHMRHPYQILIIPLTVWSGFEQGYNAVDYTAAYISCSVGVHMIGYAMICFGVCDALCSIAFTPLVKLVGRVPVFTFAAINNATAIIIMFYWRPDPNNMFMFFLIPAMWGISDAVWQTQINALYGVLFPGDSEPAFSNFRLWNSIGFIFAYSTHFSLCNRNKLYLTIGFLFAGMIGYYLVEILQKCKSIAHDQLEKVKPVDKFIC